MTLWIRRLRPSLPWLVALLLSGCATRSAPRTYAQATDSATSGCLRNPSCYTQVGNEAPLPWLSQSVRALGTATAALRLLEAADLARVEQVLTECARNAHFEVNERELGEGQRPTKEQCARVLRRENGQDVTLAMELGRLKHEAAIACVRAKLGPLFPDNVSVNPHYKLDASGRWRLLDPAQAEQWRREGLFGLLLGVLIPDVVVHASGNPLQGQRVYDFKFPCLPDNRPRWRPYPNNHPHSPARQDDKYKEATGIVGRPSFVSPQFGISQ
ncbi:hypothetical protein P2318_31810 [Myxococcaceae bacterium GXIMD 01537]